MNVDDNNSVYYYYDEPVVYEPVAESPLIRTAYAMFHAPDLAGAASLQKGDFLWSTFVVDLNDKPAPSPLDNAKLYTATHFKYAKVNVADVILPEKEAFDSFLSDDYSESISSACLYRSFIDNSLFFGFTHKNQSDNSYIYEYELVLNPEKERNSNYPTFYIRAKKPVLTIHEEIASVGQYKKDEIIFAFQMSDFINYYRKNISNTGPIRFNLKYKTGQDEAGKDIYREFLSNPISWNPTKAEL
ncbi:hypothetical protein FACS189420_5880 [Bacteroidia bacterium]|nr:hypothetical protein FACS18947_5580 [Bacteroidia bacterium]GHV71300.1 hypothetical protein FACS189420_5880 [Bacteroidia bacterium]